MIIRQKAQIGTDTSKYFTSITDTITASSTDRQAPTAAAVYEAISALGGGGGHVILEGNTPRAQKDSLEFRTTSAIALAATNESTRTVIEATLQSNSVNAAEISAGAVGNSELASNAVDSTKIVNGGVSVLDLGQHGASSGQVLKWNGTQWAPANDTVTVGAVTGTGTSGFVPRWTGTSTLGRSDTLFWDNTNGRLGINTTTPARRIDIRSTSGSEAGILIQSDGTIDRDVSLFEMAGVAAGPYTQRAKVDMDVYSNAGIDPDGQALLFKLSRDGGSTFTPLALYNSQALFNRSGSFTLANNQGELRITPQSTNQVRIYHTALIAGSAYGTLDTTNRLRVEGRTQTSATNSAVFNDGGAQRILTIRDDQRIGIRSSAPSYTLDISATDGIRIPIGNTANRPASTPQGVIRYNTDSTSVEVGTGSAWVKLSGSGGGGVTDHGALTGLSDDDHSQYALLAGRSGGQTLTGGTAAGDDLTLRSTTNATKGDIIMADQGGNVLLGGAATASELRFLEPSGSGSNYTAIKAQAQAGNVTITLPAADGAAGQVVKTDGSGTWDWTTIVAPPGTENIESSVFTALKGIINQVDCSAGTITVTPPASPVIGDRFSLTDATASAGTNNITVDFDTANQNLYGIQQNYIINVDGGYVEFIYMGSTTGWIATK